MACGRRSRREERFCATREDFLSLRAAFSASRSKIDDRLQPFLQQVALELLGLERDAGGTAAVAEDPQSRRPDPHESRRLAALAGSDGCLAGGRDRDETLR